MRRDGERDTGDGHESHKRSLRACDELMCPGVEWGWGVVISAGRAVSILTSLELSLSLAEFIRVRERLLGRGNGRSKRPSKTAI